MTRVAAVDCGTNTIRLLIADLIRDGAGRAAFARGAGLDADVDPAAVLLRDDVDVLRAVSSRKPSIGAEIIGSRRDAEKVRHLVDQALLHLGQIRHQTSLLNLLHVPCADSVPMRSGKISALAPCRTIAPSARTAISSAMFRMRS